MPSDCDTPPAPRCANSAHDQCISEVQSPAKHATLAPCMPLAWAQLHDSFAVTQPAQCCSNSPNLLACPLSFTTCYYLQTSYCKGKQLFKCNDGQRCNFNERAIGCEPKDAPTPLPASPCADSAHDQCISEVRAPADGGSAGLHLSCCICSEIAVVLPANAIANSNPSMPGCSHLPHPCRPATARARSWSSATTARGATSTSRPLGVSPSMHRQPTRAPAAPTISASAWCACQSCQVAAEFLHFFVGAPRLHGTSHSGVVVTRPAQCSNITTCMPPLASPATLAVQTSYCKGNLLFKCNDGQRCNFNEQAIGCEPKDTPQPDNGCANSAHDQCISEVRSSVS